MNTKHHRRYIVDGSSHLLQHRAGGGRRSRVRARLGVVPCSWRGVIPCSWRDWRSSGSMFLAPYNGGQLLQVATSHRKWSVSSGQGQLGIDP